MVTFNLKTTAGDGFLYETAASTKVDDLIDALVDIHNARLRAGLIAEAVRGLAAHGAMQPPEVAADVADPSGQRSGNPPDPDMAEVLNREVHSLEEYVDKKQVSLKVALTMEAIEEKIDGVRGAVATAYPEGLPEWDLARMALDDPIEKLKHTPLGGSLIDAGKRSLWAFNKEFLRGTLVSDRLGRNEKTKVVAKLTTKGAGPPAREPVVSEAERNAMASFYFKRQEELKKLAQADEDDYLNSEWADPKGMKRNLQGLNDVKAPGFR
ncbi:hypothetical protein ACHAXT_006334 [Thalassiosira profunda]